MSTFKHKATGSTPNPISLSEYLRQTVIPRLTAEGVFSHDAHRFKKTGNKLRGGCPWHDSESGSSFCVSLDKGLAWYCAGCDIGGGPIQYLYRLSGGKGSPRGRDFIKIMRQACDLAGVQFPERELTPEQQERAERLQARRGILEIVYAWGQQQLAQATERAAEARAYLAKRGLSPEAIIDLEIGFYWDFDGLWKRLSTAGHPRKDLCPSNAVWPSFTGYCLFPWRDEYGQPLTAYGRWPGSPPDKQPKTLALPNPKEDGQDIDKTKRSLLYFDRAMQAACRDRVVVVEGVLDGAVLQARGEVNVVACVAAHISEQQIETLKRCRVETVVISLDPDRAGDANVRGNVERLLAAGITPYVAPRLPDGIDPDEFVLANGIDAWRANVNGAIHGLTHVARSLVQKHQGGAA